MKVLKYISGLLLCASALSSCSDFTEIDQKGMNILNTTDQLEMLLNHGYTYSVRDLNRLCGTIIFYPGNLGTLLANPVKTSDQILLSYDEAAHAREYIDLVNVDDSYENSYNVIGTVANPILSRLDVADGTQEKKAALKAEALTLRAYFHWLAAIKFARAYNPATADTERCIAYLLETHDIKQPTEQLTQKQVYEHILADLDAAIALDALPVEALNHMRVCKAAPYAIKALVLMYMQQPAEAAKVAETALSFKDQVSDYNDYISTTTSATGMPVKVLEFPKLSLVQDYFDNMEYEYMSWLTPHYYEMFEDKHLVKDWFGTYHTSYWMGSWEATEPMMNELLRGMFAVDGGSLSNSDSTVGRINVSTPHMYLILAENAIDNNRIDEAMGYLDKIRVGRFFPEDYAPLQGAVKTKSEAITMLKKVQHGENCFNVHNFINLKRWNELEDYKTDYSWSYGGKTYTLRARSDMWVFPFPKNLMGKNPNFQHNYETVQM